MSNSDYHSPPRTTYNEATDGGDTENRDAVTGRSPSDANYPVLNVSTSATFSGNSGNNSHLFPGPDNDYFVIDLDNDGVGSVSPDDLLKFSVTNANAGANFAIQWRLVDDTYLNTTGPYGQHQFYLQYSSQGVRDDAGYSVYLDLSDIIDVGTLPQHAYLAFQIVDYNNTASNYTVNITNVGGGGASVDTTHYKDLAAPLIPYGISNTGEIVGQYTNMGFFETGSQVVTFSFPNATNTVAKGVNAHGQIVGQYTANNVMHGFLYNNGQYLPIDYEPPVAGTQSYAAGINDAGLIVGNYFLGNRSDGFLDNGGSFTPIDHPLAGAKGTVVTGINNSNEIVGYYVDSSNIAHGFTYKGGTWTTIDNPAATTSTLSFLQAGTIVTGVNDSGALLGTYLDSHNLQHGFVYSNGTWTVIDDPDLPAQASIAAGYGTWTYGINNAGQVVGIVSARDGNGTAIVPTTGYLYTPSLTHTADDFSGDHHSDIVWRNDNGTVSLWDNGQKSGAHVISPAGVVPAEWSIVGQGDFNGNGKSDLLWQNANGAVSIWDDGQKSGAHVVVNAGVVPSSWHIAGTGDFDGNNKSDILWQNDNGTVSIWNDGQIGGAHVVVGAGVVPSSWHIAGTGDFDGNGKSDILWKNDNGTVSIWSDGQISGAHVVVGAGIVPSSWHIAGIGDFDGNGKSDILWQNDNGTVSIWNDGQISGSHVIVGAGVVPGSWHVAGTGDFDGNGKADILWHNDNGTVSIWDNGAVAGAHVVAAAGVVSADWHIV